LRYGDGRLLVPDCPRQPLLQHAGNFAENPRAAVVLPDVTAAALLHLAGRVELLWDAMALVERPSAPGGARPPCRWAGS